jgi:RNase P/RNase MRP subunit POP5
MVRIKHRYIICQFSQESSSRSSYTIRDITNAVREKIQSLFGDVGAGEFGNSQTLSIRYFDSIEGSFIFVVRAPREAETNVRFAIACLTSIKANETVCVRTLRVASCSRTCIVQLRELLEVYIENCPISSAEKSEKRGRVSESLTSFDG